jgi:hypothetical protein
MPTTGDDRGDQAGRLRDRLLDQFAPAPGALETYRKGVQAMLDANEKRLRRERWIVGPLWIYLVLVTTGFLVIGGLRPNTPLGTYFTALGGVWLLVGAVFLLAHLINTARFELLKELKGIELRLLTLEERLDQAKPAGD